MVTVQRTIILRQFALNLLILVILFIDTSFGQDPHHIPNSRRRPDLSRRRPPLCPNADFIRMGNKCIFLSKTTASWTEAFHKCRDMKGELVTLEKAYEDRHLKQFLQKEGRQREQWIGGIFNGQHWTWGGSGKNFEYEGFSKMRPPNVTADEKLFCVAMDPKKNYRWIAKSCIEPNLFICQTKQQRQRRPTNRIQNNNSVVLSGNHLKNYHPAISETQNDIDPQHQAFTAAAAYRKSETKKRISLLNRVARRCQNRDATVLKHLKYANLSESECIKFFIQRWNRKQKRFGRRNRTVDYFADGPPPAFRRVTPKTVIKSRLSELHPAAIVETHDVWA